MICCKVITDFNSVNGNFEKLCGELNKLGDIYFHNNALYFGDSDNIATNEEIISNIIKRAGYKKFYIDVYDKDNQPQEAEEDINGWIITRLIRINYNLYEEQSQKLFHDISRGLDILDEEIQKIRDQKEQEQNGEEES